MGKIRKIHENELGGSTSTDVYPVTSTKAVYDDNNASLDTVIENINTKLEELDAKDRTLTTDVTNLQSSKEDAANKVTSLANPSDVTFPTSKAVVSAVSDAKNNLTNAISGRIQKIDQCISPDNGASLLSGGSRVLVRVTPNTSYYISCTLEYGVRFGAYAQYKMNSVRGYIDGTLVVQEAGSKNYEFILKTTAETNFIAFSSRTHDINLSIFRDEPIYTTLDNVKSTISKIDSAMTNNWYDSLFDINNSAATPMPSTFIKGVEIELLDTSLLPLDLSAITVNLAYCGKSSTGYQLSTRIGGLTNSINLIGDYGRIDIPTEDLSVVEVGNEVIKVRYLLYKPNMPSDYTYTINNAKFSDSVIIPQFAKYIPISIGEDSNIYVKRGLTVIKENIYLKNILRFIKVDNYDFSNNGDVARMRVNYLSWNYSTKMLYLSYRIVTTDTDGNEKTLVEISGANDNTKKMADEKGLVYFDFVHSTGIRIKALYDMSSVKFSIEQNLTLANSEFSEAVVLSSSAPIELADYPNDYAKYISSKSTENCAYNMCQKLEWNRKTPRFNMALGCDFHKEVRCFEDLCYWTNDAAIKACLSSIVVAGDYLSNGTAYPEAEWNARAKAVVDAMQYTDKPVLFCQGNHDKNWEQAGINPSLVMSDAKLRESIYNPMYNRLSATDKQNFHFPEDVADALYYYFDQSVNGRVFRYIVLNEYDLPETINENGVRKYSGTDDYTGKVTTTFATYISQSQFEFVNSVLAATPDNYVVLVVRHTPYGDTALANTGNAINSLIKAYKERTAGSVSIDELDDLSAYTITYDFTSKTESHIVVINGHHHETKWAEDETYGTLRLQGTALGTAGFNARFIGSATEANCDILSINTSNNEAYVLRYGVAKIVESQTYFDVSNPKIV